MRNTLLVNDVFNLARTVHLPEICIPSIPRHLISLIDLFLIMIMSVSEVKDFMSLDDNIIFTLN